MIIETIVCDKCGASVRIETDIDKFLEKRKKDFIKQHEKCKKEKP